MDIIPTIAGAGPRSRIDAVILEHGAWRVLGAAALALVRRRRPREATALTAHLRRDIGLPPEPPSRGYLDVRH